MKPTERESIERIEYEMTTLIRRAVYKDNSENKIGDLERAVYLLLRELEACGPARLKALADSFKLDISTLSRQAAAVEAKGLIARSQDPNDKRSSIFYITEQGKAKLKEDKKKRIGSYREMLRNWSDEEREIFGELLFRMNEALID
ncbi:MarR family transcriptional regulator [Terribacillus sp. 7520-G]|uniref:MarR family winged helix-turn-helix transcriptional regulator n=1 Tax=Terribacillus TaxID=459532 RepID=UPI000BA7C41A|nr:MarR family transcriptional regulator [Terribacillus sp. 7520-G]PAD38290.1 MarR family transcriptional regulator [Terribacillus sp. 7520-G]